MPKMKLSCRDRSYGVQSVMKTRQDNNVIDLIDMVFVEIKIELSGLIWLGAVYD